MNLNKLFEAAKKAGIEPFEISYGSSKSLSAEIYNDNLEKYESSNDCSFTARGIYEGKLGSFSSDRVDASVADVMVDAIIQSAKYGLEGNPDFFIEKGQKYKKVNTYSKAADEFPGKSMIDLSLEMSKKIRDYDKRIQIAEVGMEKSVSEGVFANSKGLKLKSKSSHMVVWASTKIVDGDNVETEFDVKLFSDPDSFNSDEFATELAKKTVSNLGAAPVKSGKYNVVFSQSCVSSLLRPLLGQLSSFAVSQHLSLFENKLGQQLLSSKLTVTENPFTKTPFASSFDREGMPRQKKVLINKGKVNTFLYDLEMAKKDGTSTTGNASFSGGSIRPGLGFVEVKPGKKSFDELLEQIGNGLYIDSLAGTGTGYNTQSGDYSLQASGYLIENGKLSRPVTLITVAGNVLKEIGKIIAVGSDVKLMTSAIQTPSIAIRKLSVSGN